MKVHDIDALKEYLSNSIVTPEAKEELQGYIGEAFYRILFTLELIPENNNRGKLLEIGANPYFLTLLIKKFKNYDLELTNFFGKMEDEPKSNNQIIDNSEYNEKHILEFKNINVEKQSLPYPDNYFDVVLFCEVIEHLTEDPIFVLSNIHRVLKNNGVLILSTPNVYRYGNLLKFLAKRKMSIYDPFSSYGIYGRHNREYSLYEIKDILENSGFNVSYWGTLYSREKKGIANSLFAKAVESLKLGEYIIIKVIKNDTFKWYYPNYLYRGKENIIGNEIKMDENIRAEWDSGFNKVEFWNKVGYIRWTKKQCTLLARPEGLKRKLRINFFSQLNEYKFKIVIYNNFEMMEEHECEGKRGWQELFIDLDSESEKEVKIEIIMDKAWTPKELRINEDMRELGIAIEEISLVE